MGEKRVLLDSTATLVSYPRVSDGQQLVLEQPASVTVRIGTPAVTMPAEGAGVSATVDTLSVVSGSAAAVGADEIDLGDFDAITDSETTLLDEIAANPQTTLTKALIASRTYAVAVAFSITVQDDGGPTLGVAIGTITATVVADADGLTISSEVVNYTTQSGLVTVTFALASSGLDLLVRASGDFVGFDMTRTVMSLTATPSAPDFVKGRSYLIILDDGDVLQVESAKSETDATTLYLTEPLKKAVPAGSSIKGFAVSKALTALQTALVGKGCTAQWRAVLASGAVIEWAEPFRVVRRLLVPTLSPTALSESWSNLRSLVSGKDKSFEELIASTWTDEVEPLLTSRGIDPEDVISADHLEPVHKLYCVERVIMLNPNVTEIVRTAVMEKLQKAIEKCFASTDWHDTPQDETPAPRADDKPAIARGIRLVR